MNYNVIQYFLEAHAGLVNQQQPDGGAVVKVDADGGKKGSGSSADGEPLRH